MDKVDAFKTGRIDLVTFRYSLKQMLENMAFVTFYIENVPYDKYNIVGAWTPYTNKILVQWQSMPDGSLAPPALYAFAHELIHKCGLNSETLRIGILLRRYKE
jgi:hypothetical protein